MEIAPASRAPAAVNHGTSDKRNFLRQHSTNSQASSLAAEHVALEYGETSPEEAGSNVQALTTEFAASVNLTKNLVGSGIFTLPLALNKASVIPGLLMMLFIGSLCGGSFILIAFLCRIRGCKTYREMGAKYFGPVTAFLIDLSILINAVFACLAYVILVCDFFEDGVFQLFSYRPLRWHIVLVDTLIFILPLSLIKDLTPLRIPSMIGLAIIGYIFFYVVGDWLTQVQASISTLENSLADMKVGVFFSASVFTGAFKAHYNSPTFYRELGENLAAHARVVRNSYVSAFMMYAIFAVAGFGIYGAAVQGNILRNYGEAGNGEMNLPIVIALIGMGFAITFTYPLVFNSGRAALYGLVPAFERAKHDNPERTHIMLTSTVVAIIALGGCFITDVSTVVGLTGATVGMSLCFILPGVAALKLVKSGDEAGAKHATFLTAFAFLLLMFGSISVVVSTAVVLDLI